MNQNYYYNQQPQGTYNYENVNTNTSTKSKTPLWVKIVIPVLSVATIASASFVALAGTSHKQAPVVQSPIQVSEQVAQPEESEEVEQEAATETKSTEPEVKQVINYVTVQEKTQNYTPTDGGCCSYGYSTGRYKVNTSLLYVRSAPSKDASKVPFTSFSSNAQSQIKKLNGGNAADGLVKGCVADVSVICGNWGKIPSGWICLDYCAKV